VTGERAATFVHEGHGYPDLGVIVLLLLASTLSGLADRLAEDGFGAASDLVADLVDVTDDYLTRMAA
jgi:hypothetical protein